MASYENKISISMHPSEGPYCSVRNEANGKRSLMVELKDMKGRLTTILGKREHFTSLIYLPFLVNGQCEVIVFPNNNITTGWQHTENTPQEDKVSFSW